MISVVIPCFNAVRFVGEAIESALRQSSRDLEVIVIDDGSTDDSRKIIASFGDAIRAEFGANRGAAAARNRGTALARGSFIQYLDADDLLEPATLATRRAVLEESGADVAYTDWQRLIETAPGQFQEDTIFADTMEGSGFDPEVAALTHFWRPPAALLYRRGIVERIGGWNESLVIIQDARFLFDAALHDARFVHVPGIGARYRVHLEHSLSRRNPAASVREIVENALQVEQVWRERGGLSPARTGALIRVLSGAARESFESDRTAFKRALQAVRRLHPGWLPRHPRSLAVLSLLLGYPAAETCASWYRRLRRHVSLPPAP